MVYMSQDAVSLEGQHCLLFGGHNWADRFALETPGLMFPHLVCSQAISAESSQFRASKVDSELAYMKEHPVQNLMLY